MSSPSFLSRRDFAKLATTGAGAALFGCSSGIFATESELVLTLSGQGRLLDGSGRVLASQPLAPGTASGPAGSPVIRPASVSSGIGLLRIPTPTIIGFARSPGQQPVESTRVDRARDGSLVSTTFQSLGEGIPTRRTVQVPAHSVELVDAHEFRHQSGLSVFERRRIELWQHGRLVADVTIHATGEVQLANGPRFRPGMLARALLPAKLEAQSDCGGQLLLNFLAATLGVIAALGTCGAGPWCIIGLVSALIQWAQVIGEMEACRQT